MEQRHQRHDSRLRRPFPLPRIPRAQLASLANIFPIWPRFLPFSPTAKPGPRLLCIVGSVSVACWFFCQYFLCIVVMFLQHISFRKCQARVYSPWQKIEPCEEDICLRLKNWFCSCAVWMSALRGWMKKAKQNGGRKAFSSRGRFLSRNKEPRSSQSLWFIITLGIPHSCPTFCIRIFKTEFVLPKLSSGSSSSSRSSASCWGDLQLYNSYRSLLLTNI